MGLIHRDAGDRDPGLQVFAQLVADDLGVGPQGRLLVLGVVVGVVPGRLAQGRLDLDVDEGGKVIDVEQRLG